MFDVGYFLLGRLRWDVDSDVVRSPLRQDLRDVVDLYLNFFGEVLPLAYLVLKVDVSEVNAFAVDEDFPVGFAVYYFDSLDGRDIFDAVAFVVARVAVMSDLLLVLKKRRRLLRLCLRDVRRLIGEDRDRRNGENE